MERAHEMKARITLSTQVTSRLTALESNSSDSLKPLKSSKGKDWLRNPDDLMTDFSGARHPPEPVDTKGSTSIKGPFLEDLSIRSHNTKPNPDHFRLSETLNEDPDHFPYRGSQNTEKSAAAQDSDEKDCVWDTSLPPSGNVSPLSSMDSASVSMSVVNSCTSRSDGMLSFEKNFESTKTSASRPSDSSGLSEESNWSDSTGSANKPHKGNDPRWNAIMAIRARDGSLGMGHFRLHKRLGCGDIGSVHLSELNGTHCYFAMKVMDKASLESRKKLNRAQTEREILQMLDHPFLPTLYTHFETDRFSCLVMEACTGGDLHTLRQRQPGKHFSEYAARFYAAEVLLALEYLHMLGIVYRDLKPENVLVRDDGHIMLSDFDLSLRCTVSPTLIKASSLDAYASRQHACMEPTSACIQPSCFLPRLLPKKPRKVTWKPKPETLATSLPELLAEPTSARSMSFVGTHEYLAPEIIKGEGHGSAVDWWTFGIFLHELLYGKTPFKGSGNRATLFNVVGQQLKFPDLPSTSHASRDLMNRLLAKEPQHRVGVKRGATEIKQHPFFEGVNWALIRCSTPPQIPRPVDTDGLGNIEKVEKVMGTAAENGKGVVGTEMKSGSNYLDFEFF